MPGKVDYSQIFHDSPAPHFVVKKNNDGGFEMWEANVAACKYFHSDHDSLINKSLSDVLDEATVDHFFPVFEKALSEKKLYDVAAPDGYSDTKLGGFWVRPFQQNGECLLYITGIPDSPQTEIVRRERDDAISLLTSVFDVSEVGIIVTDRHQRIVRINESFVRIYGWNRDETIGHKFTEFVAEQERERVQKAHDEFLESGIRSSGEMRLIRKDKKIANALFTTATLDLSQGRKFQVTTLMDITLRKQMENSLVQAKEQADMANQAKSTFLANMSHELRTPLNAIIGFSEMMMKETFGPLGNDRYTDYIGDVHVSARHLLEIINEVLDMSKIEAGRVELDEDYFDIGDMIRSVVRMIDSRVFSANLSIRDNIEEKLPPLYGDPRLVRQVLINILGNAIKFSPAGSAIDIAAKKNDIGGLDVVITDYGKGIPKDRIDDALEPFGQINKNAEQAEIQGTGLGLPLAKAMMELHSGELFLESDVGKGTTVTIRFCKARLEHHENSKKDTEDSPLAKLKK